MLRIGSVIDGKYKILNVIGRGGMSIVYLAMNERVNKQWAIKEAFCADKKEIEMLKKLRHPHLPSVVDVIERGDSLLIVMDYIEGRSLDEIVRESGAQPQYLVLEWAKQLCGVLVYLHAQKPAIIYRDMKPSNVMLKPDGKVMLIDFGAAREYKPFGGKDTILLGTRGYAAPEQYEKEEQSDVRTDIYCFGVMLFQLLTGESPYGLRPICMVNPSLSSGLEAIIIRCTQVKKEERYQSCEELLYALEHYWEWDSAYQKQQSVKFIRFVLSAVLTGVLGISAGVFLGLKLQVRKSNYNAYLLAARNAVEKEEELFNYQKAIYLNPYREEAYLALLKEGFLDDNVLTSKESETLRKILVAYGDGKQTNERIFQENQRGYEAFAYEAGIAYYYKFEEKNNKKYAKGYFKTTAEAKYLTSSQVERSRRLFFISDYYARVGMVDEAGDATITYRDYWEDLTALSEGNLVELDNERTALVMYQELVGQLISRTVEFQNAGVEREDMMLQLEQIEQHLKEDFINIEDKEIKQLIDNINTAKKMVDAVFTKKEQRNE